MEYSDYKYVDVATDGVFKRNNVFLVSKAVFPGMTDCYRTYFRYPEAFKNLVDKTKSVKGYNGMAYADWFPIDFDDKDDPSRAAEAARNFLARIGLELDVDIKQLPIFFSGAKGFHIMIPARMIGIAPSLNIAQIFKKFAELLLVPWGIKYDSSIYDIVRIFRIANTINSKTGLHKIPLTAEEMIDLNIGDVKELAKNQRTGIEATRPVFNERLAAIYRDASDHVNNKPKINGETVNLDIVLPKGTKLCYVSLMRGVGEGQRDESAYRLACHLRKQGFAEDMTLNMLSAWNNRNSPPMNDRILAAKVKSAYSSNARNDHGCNDPILSAHCDKSCYLINKSASSDNVDLNVIKTFDEAVNEYQRYVDNLKTRGCILDIPEIGTLMRSISPGEVCTILARSGVGKTAMVINLMMRLGIRNSMPQLFFTMEQPIPQVFERMAQIAIGRSGADIEDAYSANGNSKTRKEIEAATRVFFKNVLLIDKDFLTPDEMIQLVRLAERKKINSKIGIVVIDYIGRMKGGNRSSYEVLSENAQQIKHMAKELDLAVISLAQVSRKGGEGTIPVEMDSARDSGQIEEASDFVIGMWRPKMKENDGLPEDELAIKLLKNRKGPAGKQTKMKFIKKFLRFDDYEHSFWDTSSENEVIIYDDDCPF